MPSSSLRDALYVRETGYNTAVTTYVTRIDVGSARVQGALPEGSMSADSSKLYHVEAIDGATRTRIDEIDTETGDTQRSFTIDGDWVLAQSNDGPIGTSADGRWLVLARSAVKIDNEWMSGLAIVDLRSGALRASNEYRGATTLAVLGIASAGDAVAVAQYGAGESRLRIWDAASRDLLPGADAPIDGFMSATVRSKDGARLYFLESGGGSARPSIRTVDLGSRRISQTDLPGVQSSSDFEKSMLWSLALSPDGATLYAVDPALGWIDEIDATTPTMNLKRSARIPVASEDDPPAALRALFPIAEAKRYVRGGARLSPDGRTLYAAGTTGLVVIDATSLRERTMWARDLSFDSLGLAPDGTRLYAVDDSSRNIVVLSALDGSLLATMHQELAPMDVVRVEAARDVLLAPAPPAPCNVFLTPPDPHVPAEIQHLKTSATVVAVESACTVRARISGGQGTLERFSGRDVVLRATDATTFASASKGDLNAIGGMRLEPGETFTLSFDSRAFPDGSYPVNYMDR
ncbi:MAG: hypothetical protein KGN00_00325 [Chloroflexota bacterium]|nr:hypothetical protein [Chloroflexota bacterium]